MDNNKTGLDIMFKSMSNPIGMIFIFPFFLMALMLIFSIAVLPYFPIIFLLGLPYVYFEKADLSQLLLGHIYHTISEQMFFAGFIIAGIYGIAWTLWYIDIFGDFLKKEYIFKATKFIYGLAIIWITLFGLYKVFYYSKTGTWDFPKKPIVKKEIIKTNNLKLPIFDIKSK